MKFHQKAIGFFVSVMLALTNIAVFAYAESVPQTEFSVEPKRTESGIEYELYIENSNFLSTLFFEIRFDGEYAVREKLFDNDCFDLLHTVCNSDNGLSIKGYLGKTGNKAGFSSAKKIKVAVITVPTDVSFVGEISATVSDARCAGITEPSGNAVNGNVTVSETNVKFSVRECGILHFDENKLEVISAKNRTAAVIIAAYDQNGSLVGVCTKNVALRCGKNAFVPDETIFANYDSVSVTVWDSISTMRPLADKETIVK